MLSYPSGEYQNSALHYCCFQINVDVYSSISKLWQHRSDHTADTNKTSNNFFSRVSSARTNKRNCFENSYYRCCRALIENGADWNSYNYRGWRPIDYLNENFSESLELLDIIHTK